MFLNSVQLPKILVDGCNFVINMAKYLPFPYYSDRSCVWYKPGSFLFIVTIKRMSLFTILLHFVITVFHHTKVFKINGVIKTSRQIVEISIRVIVRRLGHDTELARTSIKEI